MTNEIETVAHFGPDEESSRKGVAKVEVTVTYEDGWKQTIETPVMVQLGPAQQQIQTPQGVQVIARYIKAVELAKAIDLLEHICEDLRNTIPTEEDLEKARKIMQEREEQLQKRAAMIAQAHKGRTPGKGSPVDKSQLEVPPGAPTNHS